MIERFLAAYIVYWQNGEYDDDGVFTTFAEKIIFEYNKLYQHKHDRRLSKEKSSIDQLRLLCRLQPSELIF